MKQTYDKNNQPGEARVRVVCCMEYIRLCCIRLFSTREPSNLRLISISQRESCWFVDVCSKDGRRDLGMTYARLREVWMSWRLNYGRLKMFLLASRVRSSPSLFCLQGTSHPSMGFCWK